MCYHIVNAIYFWNEDSINTGQAILRDIIKDKYNTEIINFDYLNKIKEIEYSDDFDANVELMGNYLINKEPKILGFYTICNSFIISLFLAELSHDVVLNFVSPDYMH